MMKKIAFVLVSLMVLATLSFTIEENVKPIKNDGEVKVTPENVQVVLEKTCIMCHNNETKNMKGKMKLNFDKFTDGYKTHKKISKYMKIAEEVKEGEMPPAKFLKKYPEKGLSEDEKKTLIKWAEDMAKELSGE